MTLEQIRKMTDKEVTKSVAYALGWSGFYYNQSTPNTLRGLSPAPLSRNKPVPNYSSDLKAAMSLVPPDAPALVEFECALMAVLDWDINTSIWRHWVVGKNPRNLCEAYLLWKDGAK